VSVNLHSVRPRRYRREHRRREHRSAEPQTCIARLALQRSDGSAIERGILVTPPSLFDARHVRAIRIARQSLLRELATSGLGLSQWAKRTSADVDEALQLIEGSTA
jgi:hypothetical protein